MEDHRGICSSKNKWWFKLGYITHTQLLRNFLKNLNDKDHLRIKGVYTIQWK